jgi:hypothetical protein
MSVLNPIKNVISPVPMPLKYGNRIKEGSFLQAMGLWQTYGKMGFAPTMTNVRKKFRIGLPANKMQERQFCW